MKRRGGILTAGMLALMGSMTGVMQGAEETPPKEWIDPSTGHRIVRLSEEPGSASLYFHQNAYVPGGDKLLVTTPKGLSTIELKGGKIDLITPGPTAQVVGGRKQRQVYFLRDRTVCTANIDTHEVREIATLPFKSSSGLTVNADETLLAGSFIDEEEVRAKDPSAGPAGQPLKFGWEREGISKAVMMEERLAAHLPMWLYTVNIQTGEIRRFHHSNDWLNHLQFSPTDPKLLMFCHEGPWHKVDRIWTIRTDTKEVRKVHTRTMEMEIAGHEFWDPRGQTVWYDLQTPRGKEFWIAGMNLATGQAMRYKVEQNQWSVHYNVSPDGKRFAGDGGGPGMVARAPDGQWINLFTPQADGTLKVEHLVNMAKHDYKLEPNVNFTPDMRWIVFRSNMHGASQVYAVEVARSDASQ